MLLSKPEPIVDTLEEDLGNLSLLQILLIAILLIVIIPIGLAIKWLTKLWGYLRNFANFRNYYSKNKLCK